MAELVLEYSMTASIIVRKNGLKGSICLGVNTRYSHYSEIWPEDQLDQEILCIGYCNERLKI